MTKILALIYLADVAHGIDGIATAFAVAFGLAAIIFGVLGFAFHAYGNSKEEDEIEKKKFRSYCKRCVWLMILPALISVLVPSPKVCYIAAGAKTADYIANETAVGKAMNENAVTIIKDISQIIHNYAQDKDDKTDDKSKSESDN